MGIIITYLKKKSKEEILEEIDKEIKAKRYSISTTQSEKKVVRRLILILVFIYFVTLFVLYAVSPGLPYLIVLPVGPIIIIFMKISLTRYYNKQILRNRTELRELNDEKEKMLDNVMETETYKRAKIILKKFAPEHHSIDITPAVPLTTGNL